MGDQDLPEKVLTVDEANALLPKAIPLIQQLQGLQRSIAQTNEELTTVTNKLSQGNGYPIQSLREQMERLTKHQLQLIDAFQSAVDQLEGLGCLLKDLGIGLLDFYTMRKGELVFLCWKLGEEQIRFWHTLEGSYASRQPLA